MDYTPNDVKEDMLKARKKITTLIKDYMEEEGYQSHAPPFQMGV